MQEYPSISGSQFYDMPIYAWDKLDGSNIRAKWNRKHKKFVLFGTRERLLDETDPIFGEAPELIRIKYEESLSEIFIKNGYNEVICFFEYYGEESFAGFHNLEKEMTVTLIDVYISKLGFLLSKDFFKLFRYLDIPKLLYQGKITVPFIESIKNSTLNDISFEGVICKGPYKHPGYPWMCKIKTNQWLNKLKAKCNGDEKLFERLR